MRGPSIQKTAAVSLMLHLIFFVLSVVLINYSKNIVMPSPYTVTLVSPSNGRFSGESIPTVEEPKSTEVMQAKSPEESKEVTKTDKKADQNRLNERMSELEAIAKLKRNKEIGTKIAEISGKTGVAKSSARPSGKQGTAGGQKGTPTEMYIAKISSEIWNVWGFPGERKKDLQAIVSVTIRIDGTIKINDFEKRSGDPLFDKSVLKALTYASPVTRPEDEMEIGIRFTP